MILSNDSLVAFHYRSYGTFFLHKNRLHNIYRGFTHYKYYRAGFEYLIGCVFLILKALSKFYAVDWIVELGMKKPPKWVAKSHKISLLNRIDQVLSLFFK